MINGDWVIKLSTFTTSEGGSRSDLGCSFHFCEKKRKRVLVNAERRCDVGN